MDKAKDKVNEDKEEAEEAKRVDDDDIVVELVASEAVIDIIIITELRFVIKTPLDTTEDVDWLVLEVLPLSKVMDKVKDSSIVIMTS